MSDNTLMSHPPHFAHQHTAFLPETPAQVKEKHGKQKFPLPEAYPRLVVSFLLMMISLRPGREDSEEGMVQEMTFVRCKTSIDQMHRFHRSKLWGEPH